MLEEAREHVAASLGCDPIEVIFTSGGTESVNLAIKGLFWAANPAAPEPVEGRASTPELVEGRASTGSASVSRPSHAKPRILVPRGEHHATIDAVEWLEKHDGAIVEWLPIDGQGRIELDAVRAALQEHDDIALLTFLWANNEVGTIQPAHEIVALATSHGVPVHIDAVSAYGHVPVSLRESGAAAMSVSAHKIGGPLGIGALALSRTASVTPLIHGGGQQRGVRSGTQDAPAAAGFAEATRHAHQSFAPLRDRLIAGIQASVPGAVLRGDPVERLDNNAHFTFDGCQGDSLLFLLDTAGISVSTGSACQAGVPEASHVLLGMGLSDEDARGALRFTVGPGTTEAEIDQLLAVLPDAVARARRAGYSGRAV